VSTLSLPLAIDCEDDQMAAERRSPAASLRFVSLVSIWRSASWRAWTVTCWRAVRVRGTCSIDISWLMIDSVSIPEARPPT
jgi:hypothetical protein